MKKQYICPRVHVYSMKPLTLLGGSHGSGTKYVTESAPGYGGEENMADGDPLSKGNDFLWDE